MTAAYFLYRSNGQQQPERHELGFEPSTGAYTMQCPCCGLRGRLAPSRFRVFLTEDGRATITCVQPFHRPAVACPNVECSWYVEITNGRAFDLDVPLKEIAVHFRSRVAPIHRPRLVISPKVPADKNGGDPGL